MNKKNICVILGILVVIGIIIGVNIFSGKKDSSSNEKTETQTKLSVKFEDVEVVPGSEFKESNFKEIAAMSEIPSCAFEGSDSVYTYNDVEITVAEKDGKNIIYSVCFLDDNVKTDEGLKITDTKADMIKTYGKDYRNDISNKYTYTIGEVELSFVIENDIIIEIEYILA